MKNNEPDILMSLATNDIPLLDEDTNEKTEEIENILSSIEADLEKEKYREMDAYEEEQEQKAVISYEELMRRMRPAKQTVEEEILQFEAPTKELIEQNFTEEDLTSEPVYDDTIFPTEAFDDAPLIEEVLPLEKTNVEKNINGIFTMIDQEEKSVYDIDAELDEQPKLAPIEISEEKQSMDPIVIIDDEYINNKKIDEDYNIFQEINPKINETKTLDYADILQETIKEEPAKSSSGFTSSTFISPVFGRQNQDMEYPKVTKEERTAISRETKATEDFLNTLKEFRNNL